MATPAEDIVPESFHFDALEAVSMGEYKPQGIRIVLHSKGPRDMERVLLKTDSARVEIREIDVEIPPGKGSFSSVETLLRNYHRDIDGMRGHFSGPQRSTLDNVLERIQNMLTGAKPFTMVITDPLGNTKLQSYETDNDSNVQVSSYERSWADNYEYDIDVENAIFVGDQLSGEEGIEEFVRLIGESENIVGFTGAGVSVESGVPSYRGAANSIWNRYSTTTASLVDFMAREEVREEYWRMKVEFFSVIKDAQPNPSHKLFAELERRGKLQAVITQNIDGLHQVGGVSNERVVQLHGTAREIECVDCHLDVPADALYTRLEEEMSSKGRITCPVCSSCGGILKPKTIFFGEALHPAVFERATDAMRKADLVLVMGSSLVVAPANNLPGLGLLHGAKLVLINMDETMFDKAASVLLHEPSGKTCEKVMDRLSRL